MPAATDTPINLPCCAPRLSNSSIWLQSNVEVVGWTAFQSALTRIPSKFGFVHAANTSGLGPLSLTNLTMPAGSGFWAATGSAQASITIGKTAAIPKVLTKLFLTIRRRTDCCFLLITFIVQLAPVLILGRGRLEPATRLRARYRRRF